jgi:hypothetical protein
MGITVSTAVTTTGSAGSATGSATLALPDGWVEWIYLDFHASAPATTDTTIAYADTPPGGNILVVSNSATDALKFPRAGCVDNANSAITASYTRFPAGEPVTISLAQSDALTGAVTVYVHVVQHQD